MIRYATRDDALLIWPLLLELHALQGFFSLTPETLLKTLADAIDEARCLVAVKDGQIVGSFAWAVASPYYSKEKFHADLWLYVTPAHRRSTFAVRMKAEMKRAARAAGRRLMTGAVGHSLNGSRLFEKDKDFIKAGELFITRKT